MPSLLLEDDPTSSLYGEDRHRENPVVPDDPDERAALAALYAGVSRAMAQTTKLQQQAGADGLLSMAAIRAAYSQPNGEA